MKKNVQNKYERRAGVMILISEREKEIIYFALSRLLDDSTLCQSEFNEIDNLRDQFFVGNAMPTY